MRENGLRDGACTRVCAEAIGGAPTLGVPGDGAFGGPSPGGLDCAVATLNSETLLAGSAGAVVRALCATYASYAPICTRRQKARQIGPLHQLDAMMVGVDIAPYSIHNDSTTSNPT